MRIFIYWNRKDNDSAKIYKFLKNGSWITALENKCAVTKAFLYDRFEVDTYKVTGYNGEEMTLIEAMQQSDILFFFTHGNDDRILKSNCYNNTALQEFTFMDRKNAAIASCKAIIAICCSSAKVLGQHCVNNESVPYYIGFEEPIVYDERTCPNNKLRSIMYKAYGNGFNKGLEAALNGNYTAEKLVHRLKIFIEQAITQAILGSAERSLSKYSSGPQFYTEGIESLICIGDKQQIVFKDK